MNRIGLVFLLWIFRIMGENPASGLPASSVGQCRRPLFHVVGRHYDKGENCRVVFGREEEIQSLREKYERKLLEDHPGAEVKEVRELVNGLTHFAGPIDVELEKNLLCAGCGAVVNTVRFMKSFGSTNSKILDLVKKMCVDFNIMTENICDGMVDAFGNVLLTVIEQTDKKPNTICHFLLNADCGDFPDLWNVTFTPNTKPPVTKPQALPGNVRNLKVLHITDVHWDPEYVEGSWAECKLPLCCRKENVLPPGGGTKAGRYGGWKCDLPEITFDDMLTHINQQHPDIDYVLWTGDIPPHDIWDQQEEGNLKMLKRTAAKLRKAFPNTPIYPALGNHESAPPNMFPFLPQENNENPMKWLYDQLGIEWESWISANESATVRYGGYYTKVIRPGLRIVSMNMNFCYSFNWWLILDSTDPLSELQWLISVLQEAENHNESVHIIGHIPPGNSDCLKIWQTNYYNIINRYEKTVTAQFFGHTHTDKFEVYYDATDRTRPFGVGYVAPSVTTYTYLNPAYRIYHVQGDSDKSRRYVLDHETWYLDLEEANANNRPEWKKLYSAKKAYNMTNLFPEDWDRVYKKIAADKATLNLYDRFAWSDSNKRPECDDKCRRYHLCDIRSCAQYGHP